jgi:hypothetical protein
MGVNFFGKRKLVAMEARERNWNESPPQQDYAAIFAACSQPWSQGQVEGQINRLKCLKRQMYGRAQFDLLRLRVLQAS